MKVAIEVKDKGEAAAVKAAMADPTTRAFVLVMGALVQLPSDKSRKRVLEFVSSSLAEADTGAGEG